MQHYYITSVTVTNTIIGLTSKLNLLIVCAFLLLEPQSMYIHFYVIGY